MAAQRPAARRPTVQSPAVQQPVGQAPGDLATLQAFVNTLDIEQATEELASPQDLESWLRRAALLAPQTLDVDTQDAQAAQASPAAQDTQDTRPTQVAPATQATQADLETALALREALRGVLASHVATEPGDQPGDQPGDEPGAGDLGRIAAGLPTRLEVGPGGRVGVTAGGAGTTAALARILLIAANAAATGTWDRLKVCSADDCRWAFYDRSPTRSGCWCSMRICGSRAKSRAYRRRAGPVTASRSARTAGPGA